MLKNSNTNPTGRVTNYPEYSVWASMKQRCCNPKNKRYSAYGGRGINVCDRWLCSFQNFYADMGPRPNGQSIERLDNNKGYSPDNCKWATPAEQDHNRRTSRRVTLNGKTMTATQWGRALNIPVNTITNRLRAGRDAQDALSPTKLRPQWRQRQPVQTPPARIVSLRSSFPAEYVLWKAMRARCQNPRHAGFKSYGGRSIVVCERWRVFNNFIADMGPRPTATHKLRRMDKTSGFNHTNCRWEQAETSK